jgi:hypothetical protein
MFMKTAGLTVTLAIMSLYGCVPYPVNKTLQPAAQVTVRDRMNQPLAAADVTLIASAYPYGFEKNRVTKTTTVDGTAAFDSIREWRTEALMLHGAEEYFWNWCVRKTGYGTYLTTHRTARDFQSKLAIQLVQGESTPCPQTAR